jgi:hypothetical protein
MATGLEFETCKPKASIIQERLEGDPVPDGWHYTDCDPPGRMHVHLRKKLSNGRFLDVHIAFKKATAADPRTWSVEEELVLIQNQRIDNAKLSI